MISVKVRFLSSFKDLFGETDLVLRFEHDMTLRELVDEIDEKSKGNFKKSLLNPKTHRFNEHVMAIVNGKDIARRNSFDETIKDGDELTFCEISIGG